MDPASPAVSGTSVYANGLMDLASPAVSGTSVYANGLKHNIFIFSFCPGLNPSHKIFALFCTLLFYMTLLIWDIPYKTYIAFSSMTGTLQKAFQSNSCSKEYISHVHCLWIRRCPSALSHITRLVTGTLSKLAAYFPMIWDMIRSTLRYIQTFFQLLKLYLSMVQPCHHAMQWGVTNENNNFDIHMSVHRNIIPNYSQQDATFLEFIYFYRRSTCFRRFLCPSSGTHNCT